VVAEQEGVCGFFLVDDFYCLFDLHAVCLRYLSVACMAFWVACFASCFVSMFFIEGSNCISVSTVTVMGFFLSISTVMFSVVIFREGILDKTYSRAVFSAKTQSCSCCSGVSSGSPISSNNFTYGGDMDSGGGGAVGLRSCCSLVCRSFIWLRRRSSCFVSTLMRVFRSSLRSVSSVLILVFSVFISNEPIDLYIDASSGVFCTSSSALSVSLSSSSVCCFCTMVA